MKKVLFVSWEGDAQNYMKSLFLPILGAAQQEGTLSFDVCLFTWADAETREDIGQFTRDLGMGYQSHYIVRQPPIVSLLGMVAYGTAVLLRTIKRDNIDAVFLRGLTTGLFVMAAGPLWPEDCAIFFDADGFKADERADFGYWDASGAFYRVFRDMESQLARRSQGTMVRTHKAKAILADRVGAAFDSELIHVINNAKDPDQFYPASEADRQAIRAREGVGQDAPWIIYVGSIGEQYYPAEMIQLFEHIYDRDPTARLHILTGQEAIMRQFVDQSHESHQHIRIMRAPVEDVPHYLGAADVGFSLRKPTYSQQGVCPIKNAEYLLCGLPIISTSGVGDMDTLFDAHDVGLVLDDLDNEHLEQAASWFLQEVMPNRDRVRQACRAVGLSHYALEPCGRAIRQMILEGFE